MEKMNATKRSLKKDEQAVSPVIGVIMMIAIVVIIAAVVAAFAYGIIGGVKKAPSSAMVVEGVKVGEDVNVTIFHHGGDTMTEAFSANPTYVGDVWDNLEVRLNGAAVNDTAGGLWINGEAYTGITAASSFAPGDQVKVQFNELNESDSIVILHVPSDNILQRITVSG